MRYWGWFMYFAKEAGNYELVKLWFQIVANFLFSFAKYYRRESSPDQGHTLGEGQQGYPNYPSRE
jgi:hypothetical protein